VVASALLSPWYYRPYYYYPAYPAYYPVYPATVEYAPAAPTVYYQQPAAPAAVAPSTGDSGNWWYYCADSKTYYPYVNSCASEWQRVPPSAPTR
jgi:hypothetical protein